MTLGVNTVRPSVVELHDGEVAKNSHEHESRMGVACGVTDMSRKRESRVESQNVSCECESQKVSCECESQVESQNGVAKIKNLGAYVIGILKGVIN